MKIDVRDILAAHFRTLTNAKTGRISVLDILTFYGFPGLVALFVAWRADKFPEAFYSVAISVFAIFAALLFSVLIALFSILQRDVSVNENIPESKARSAIKERVQARRELIREVNANISYLILVASLGVTVLLAFTLTSHGAVIRSAASTYLVAHFVLTVLLVVTRVHTLFDEEYKR
jgi:uncharacterized membrane protein YeiB